MDKYTYRVAWSEEDREYVGQCLEFPSLSWLEETQEAAFAGIKKLVVEVVEDMRNNGEKIPEPVATKNYSGKFMVRIPAELHRELAYTAAEQKVSLNRLISNRLSTRP